MRRYLLAHPTGGNAGGVVFAECRCATPGTTGTPREYPAGDGGLADRLDTDDACGLGGWSASGASAAYRALIRAAVIVDEQLRQ